LTWLTCLFNEGFSQPMCKAAFTRQTKVDKLVLANSSWCVWSAQKESANTLANCWRQIELVSILANFYTNCFVLVNSYLTCEGFANVCWWRSTNQNTRSVHLICVTLHKMADRREDERATFQFVDEVQNCLDLWEVSSTGYNDAKKICRRSSWTSVLYAERVRFLLICGFVQTLIIFQRSLFLPWRLTYNRTKTQAATLRECPAALRQPHCKFANLACVVIWREFDAWTHEFANFKRRVFGNENHLHVIQIPSKRLKKKQGLR